MFIKAAGFKKIIKEAYNTAGLFMEQTPNGILAVSSKWWNMEIGIQNLDKKVKAAIIEIVGELPEKGEAYLYIKNEIPQGCLEGISYMGLAAEYENCTECYEETRITITGNRSVILLQEQKSFKKAMISQDIINMIDNTKIDHAKGESPVFQPRGGVSERIIWCNNLMALSCNKRIARLDDEQRFLDLIKKEDILWIN